MVFDPHEEEDDPAEYQAGEDLGPDPPDPPEPPSVEIPEAPSAPDTSTVDAPAEVAQPFWKAVVALNLAVFAVSLGPMLVYFRGQVLEGLVLVAIGLIAFAHTYRIYRNFHEQDRNE